MVVGQYVPHDWQATSSECTCPLAGIGSNSLLTQMRRVWENGFFGNLRHCTAHWLNSRPQMRLINVSMHFGNITANVICVQNLFICCCHYILLAPISYPFNHFDVVDKVWRVVGSYDLFQTHPEITVSQLLLSAVHIPLETLCQCRVCSHPDVLDDFRLQMLLKWSLGVTFRRTHTRANVNI